MDYSMYIWPSYLITFGLLGFSVVFALVERRTVLRDIQRKKI